MDKGTLAQWVSDYGDRLYHRALLKTGDPDVAADLVQETFLAAAQQMGGYRGESTPSTWLHGILAHKVADHWRRHERAPEPQGDALDESLEAAFFLEDGHWASPPARFDPERCCADTEFWTWLLRCLDALPQRQRSLFLQHLFSKRPVEAICAGLDLNPGHFRVLLYRARLKLRACLERAGVTPGEESA